MEAVDILVRVDGVDDGLFLDVIGQGQLHQDAVHRPIGIQFGDEIEQVRLARVDVQSVLEALHAAGDGLLALVADIDLAGGILADENDGEAGRQAVGLFQGANRLRNSRAQRFREGLAVDDVLFSHGSLPSSLPEFAGG